MYRWLLSLYLHPFAFPHYPMSSFFVFCSNIHIIISMLQEGLSSRSCSIDPTYQTTLTYCFFSAIGFTSAIAGPCMWGNQPHYDWSSSLFSKSFILSYMATNYWVSDLRIEYGVKTFCSCSLLFYLFFIYFILFYLFIYLFFFFFCG